MGSARRAVAGGLAVCSALLLPACDQQDAVCAPIGYTSTLTITVVGQSPSEILLCDGDLCAPSRAASDQGFMVTPPTVEGSTWTFTGHFPDDLTVRLYGDTDSLLSEQPVDPLWRRTGGSPECGGPTEADVTVRL